MVNSSIIGTCLLNITHCSNSNLPLTLVKIIMKNDNMYYRHLEMCIDFPIMRVTLLELTLEPLEIICAALRCQVKQR